MTRFETILANVPSGTILPPELKALCDYLDHTGYPISGCMKIRPDDYGGLVSWFGGDTVPASQFAPFGAGPDGSILAFWLLHGPDAQSAPIVHLGSEGNENKVLARAFREFLLLFAIGYDELGFDDLSELPQEPESAAGLRAWLRDQYGIDAPATGADMVAAAQAEVPSVEAFIENWYKRRYGSTA